MFTVVFEVNPEEGKKDEYLTHGKDLKPILESIDGFIDNERFESKGREGWILSLSTWRDEKAVVRWRTVGKHHIIQEKGRNEIFSDYRLRVCEVSSDTHVPEGMQLIEQRFDSTDVGKAKALTITEMTPQDHSVAVPSSDTFSAHIGLDVHDGDVLAHEVYESLVKPGKLLLLTAWNTAENAASWTPTPFSGAAELRHRVIRTIRDYGMFDRREAPQYYPEPKMHRD